MQAVHVLLVGAAALAGGWLAKALRQPAVLGEVAAGLLLAPGLLGDRVGLAAPGTAGDTWLEALAEGGAILLLFLVGLGSDPHALRRHARAGVQVALVGIAASLAAGIAVSLALARATPAWPHEWTLHLAVGVALAATSVGITARVLGDLGRLASPESTIILAAAVLDDIGGLLLLAVLSAMAGSGVPLDQVGLRSLAVLALAALLFFVAPHMGKRLPPLPLLAVALVAAFGLAVATEWAGLSGILGAFAAGLAFARLPQAASMQRPLRLAGLVLPAFFFAHIGREADLSALGGDATATLGVAALLAAAGTLAKLACGLAVPRGQADPLIVGVGMVPRGEVGLLVAAIALGAGIVVGWQYTALVLTAMITTAVAPPWLGALRHRFRDGAAVAT